MSDRRWWEGRVREVVSVRYTGRTGHNARGTRIELLSCGHEKAFAASKKKGGAPRPLWRWWLFCAALFVYARSKFGSRLSDVSSDLMAWCVRPEWLGVEP